MLKYLQCLLQKVYCFGVSISQLLRFPRNCDHYIDFLLQKRLENNNKLLNGHGFRRKPTAVVFVGGRNCPSFRSIYVHPRFRYSVLFVFRFLLFFVRFLVFHTLCFSLFVVLFLCLWLKTHISYTRNSQNTDSFFCS